MNGKQTMQNGLDDGNSDCCHRLHLKRRWKRYLRSGRLIALSGLMALLAAFNVAYAQETIIEAEQGTLAGSAEVYNDGSASGGQGVAFLHLVGNAFTLSSVPASTSMEVFYASQQTGSISLVINGQDAGDIQFSSNGAWTGNYTSVTKSVTIPANSTVQIINQSGDMAMNVDYIAFSGGGTSGPTCTDGIQNGSETGVDCGGSCTACAPAATCTDGIQNQGETGVDCGGPCAACATCSDGIQNQNETGIDCGGPCTACATCSDGIQNQGETGVDCGGPCAACATCSDGIQNQDETGIDCGGSCTACATTGSTQVEAEDATILGSASLYNDGAASGGQGVAFISSPGAGFRITNVPGSSSVEVNYASQASGNLSFFIDGNDAGDFSFTSTGSWTGNYTTLSTTVNVPAGSTFEVIFQNGDAAMNIDYVAFIGEATNPPAETCSDGIQNQGETGVDCGGPCSACPPVETCDDGIQNQGETGVDCGGPCSACPPVETCDDGIQNQGETGVDCGGPCTACAPAETCTDGIQNQGETGVDCGGPCAACSQTASCTDGIQNGDETGVDCGGSCVACTQTEVVVTNANNATAGEILVGGPGSSQPGFSIYTFDNDNGGPFSQCEGGCATTWPPVLVNNVESAVIDNLPAAFDQTFGVSGRCDGTLQLTYGGEPLYFYAQDNNAGDINGDGQGGVWHLVRATVAAPAETCTDGIQNQGETGVDCGGPCTACAPVVPSVGECDGFGLAYSGGSTGILYSHESLGAPCYMCTGPGYNGCVPNFTLADGFYQLEVSVSEGQSYSFGIQCGPNSLVEGVAGPDNNCAIGISCTDGVQNGDETGVDCGGSCGACPTCTDGIQNGDELGVDCGGANCSIGCDEVCNGTPNPSATVESTNESLEGANDGSITFTYPSTVTGRTNIEFSLDGGTTYPHTAPVSTGSLTISDLSPATYNVFVRWDNGDCPMDLGSQTVAIGSPPPTCTDGIRNQGEERVDCGGPCAACPASVCGNIPLVQNPRTALPSPVEGIAARANGYSFDLSTDLTTVSVSYGNAIDIQSASNPNFEFFCSCNQVEFERVAVVGTTTVPAKCVQAGDYFYFFRYKKAGFQTDDPGDQFVFSSLFTTSGARINPDQRPTITSEAANWMRFRHPHAYDGITEAIFDATGNGDQVRHLDRYGTTITDGPNQFRIDPFLSRGNSGSSHPHDGPRADVVRIDAMDIGTSPAPVYALQVGGSNGGASMGDQFNYGNMINYEITAVAGGSGAQTYNTLQNYFIGQGFDTHGDPRLASAGRASTIMVLPSQEAANYTDITRPDQFTQEQQTLHYELERDAIFTQHLITLTDENDVDDFLEGHHVFHGVVHRSEAPVFNQLQIQLDEVKIGEFSCGFCHFRDGRGSEVFNTPKGTLLPPPVYGVGLLQYITGAEAGLAWDGSVFAGNGRSAVENQTRNALVNDHLIDPDTDISAEDLHLLVAYTEFLTVPSRSGAAYDDPDVVTGEVLFNEVGCASCHQTSQVTSNDAPAEFRNIVIRPYTDMRVHNVFNGSFRTPPLWGIGRNLLLLENNSRPTLFMHDGSATSLDGAIQLHGGEASAARGAYNNLSQADQTKIINSLDPFNL